MTYANILRTNAGRVHLRQNGVANMRSDVDAPNGIDFGETVTVVGNADGTRSVQISLPETDYGAYPAFILVWANNRTLWSWTFAPVSGVTTLGLDTLVFGPLAGNLPKYWLCPVDTSDRVGYAASLKQVAGEVAASINSVSIDGSEQAGALHTAVVETAGTAPITITYRWYLDGVATSGTASTYTPSTSDAGKDLTVRAIATNAYGASAEVESEPVTLTAAAFAVPGSVTFTTTTGASGIFAVTTGSALPSAGDGAVVGDGAAVISRLEYNLDGGATATLTNSPAISTGYNVTTSPGWSGVVGVRAVSNFDREGEWNYLAATAGGSVGGSIPLYTGGLTDLEIETGTTVSKTWSAHFSGATSYLVNTGLVGPTSSGAGNVTYSGLVSTVQDVTFSITAINANGSTTRTFRWKVVSPAVAPSIVSALPDVFVVKIGDTIDYDATQHFAGSGLVYSTTGLSSPFGVSSVGRFTNTSALSGLESPYTFTITATNSLGAITSAAITVGVEADPPTALTTAGVGVTSSVYRHAAKWRTPRMFPPELAPFTLGSDPVSFAGADDQATVAVASHSVEVGQEFTLAGLTDTQGVVVNGTWTADSVSAGVSITFTAGSAASGAGSGGGASGTLRPLWAGIRWTRNTPDENGNVPSQFIETATDYIGAGEYQLLMTDLAKRGDPDTQSPRLDYSVWATESSSVFRLSHTVIPGQEFSAWSGEITVPLVVVPEVTTEWLPVSPRPKESYESSPPLVGNQGQQHQRCRTWNQGIIDPEKRGWVVTAQDENSLRLCKNGNAGTNGNPALWGFPRMDGYFGSKSGGLYLNTDDNAGAGLFIGVSGGFDGGGFGTSPNIRCAGVYIGDGTLNWAKKLTVTRTGGPGPYVSGSSGPKLAFTKGGSPSGLPEYYGNAFDRRGNFVARRPQIPEMRECTVFKTTKALLDADLAHAAGVKAAVYADATSGNRAIYTKSGASGSGSWTKGTLLRTDAQRPIFIVEQHGSRATGGAAIFYQALFKSTDGGASFNFVRELPVATYASGKEGIYDVNVAPNGALLLTGRMGAFLSAAGDEGANFTRIYTREVTAAHFYGGDHNTSSGIRLADQSDNSNGGVWFVPDAGAATLTFTRTNANGAGGLPASYNVWDMACAPSNPNRILINTNGNKGGNPAQGYATDAYLSTNGGTTWANVTSTALPGPDAERFRWGLGGEVAKGMAGFLFCPTDQLKVVAFTNQTVSHSIDGGANFEAHRAAFFDGMHNKGTGTGPLTGTDPWKKLLTVSQDSLAATWLDGTNWAQRCGLSTGDQAFRAALEAAGAGNRGYVSGASGVILPDNRVICGANRNTGGQTNVMVILSGRQSDGSYSTNLIKDLGGTTKAARSEWSLADPAGYAFVGRWGIGNVGAANAAITFDDHSGHEFIGQLMSGTTPISYWSGSGADPTTIYRSTHPKGLNNQGTPWYTIPLNANDQPQPYYYRNICVDPFNANRVLYVRNAAKSVIRSLTISGSTVTDVPLTDGSGATVNFATLVTADFAGRIPGGAPAFPESSYTDVSTLLADPNMEGLFYAIVGVHGIPNVWMRDPATGDWKNISENLPRTLWYGHVHPLTGDLILDASMGRHILPPPPGYPSVTYKGALSAQLQTFYSLSTVPNPPNF